VELSSAENGLKNAWDVCQDELCKKAKIVRGGGGGGGALAVRGSA
jgi:hypothetical protein